MSVNRQILGALLAWWERVAWGLADIGLRLQTIGAWPSQSARLVDEAGAVWLLTGTRLVQTGRPLQAAAQGRMGLLLSEADCLWGQFDMVEVPLAAIEPAVNEAVWRDCPVSGDRVRVAWRVTPRRRNGWNVEWCACLKDRVEELRQKTQLSPDARVYFAKNGTVLGALDAGYDRRSRLWRVVGVVVAGMLALTAVTLPVLMPLMLKREDVVRATAMAQALERDALPVQRQLDDLRQSAQIVDALGKAGAMTIPLATALNTLSEALPDEAWLDKIEISGMDMKIYGLASDTADLLARLAKSPAFAEVRATGASVRDASTNKERFALEIKWRMPQGGA